MLAYPLCKYANVTSCVFVISPHATTHMCTRSISCTGWSRENINVNKHLLLRIRKGKSFLATEWHKISMKNFSLFFAKFNSSIIKRKPTLMLVPTLLRLYYSIETNNLKKFDTYRIKFSLRKEEKLWKEKFNECRSEAKIIIISPCYRRDRLYYTRIVKFSWSQMNAKHFNRRQDL